MLDRVFIDTNILIYLYSEDEPQKRAKAIALFNCYDERIVSIPILNELSNVLLKKCNIAIPKVHDIVDEIVQATIIARISEKIVHKTLDLKARYGFSYLTVFI
jgi:predicted nucleic acid-binding protein